MTANQAILSTRRVPGVPSATVAPAAQPSMGFRQILGELEDSLDKECRELATVPCDGGEIGNYLTDRWSSNLRFWIVARVLLLRATQRTK